MNNLKDILAKIEQGSSWVSYDKISGTGPDKVAIKVEPGWMGRLPRETYVAVEKGKVTKLATITQKGIERVAWILPVSCSTWRAGRRPSTPSSTPPRSRLPALPLVAR